MDPNKYLTIILPALNEREAVGPVIDELREEGYERILLVDGYSTDGTAELAREKGVKVAVQEGKGKVEAMKTAIKNVDTPYFLMMDCDHTYNPHDIKRLLPYRESHDLVIGTRRDGRSNIPLINRFGNWVISETFKYLIGAQLTDVCSGMYLLNTERAKELTLSTKGFGLEVDIASQMSMHGSVGEVPITYRDRMGSKKLSRWVDGLNIFSTMFTLARKYNPMFLFVYLAIAVGIPALITLLWVTYQVLAMGVFHSAHALFGGVLIIASFQCFMLAVISVLLKRMERRLEIRLGGK